MKLYANRFFKTEAQALKFQKKNGGVLYKNVKYSHTKKDYEVEACVGNISSEVKATHPYCVAWTIWKD